MEDIMMNLNGKKLSIIGLLIAAQFVCILIGGLFYSRPYGSQVILDTICKSERVYGNFFESDKWYYPRGHGSCRDIKSIRTYYDNDITIENQNVHTFQMPLSRNGMVLGYSRWQQTLRGVLDIDIIKEDISEIATIFNISMDVRLAYRNKGDPDDAWKHYASRRLETYLACVNVNYGAGIYNCKAIPIFDLSGLYHDYYLLNIHFVHETERNIDQGLKHFDNLSLTVIHQNGDFTKIMLGLKTVFFPIVLAILIWYWRQVRSHSKSPATFEYMLLSLGLVLSILNMPLEYLTIYFDISYMSLINEIRQFIFYFVLMSFWIIFTIEHSYITQNYGQKNIPKRYLIRLSSLFIGCSCMFINGIYDCAVQLENPFNFYWVRSYDASLSSMFNIAIGIFLVSYFLFLTKTIWTTFKKIKYVVLPTMSSDKQSQYDESLYRFKFITLATLMCALLTTGFTFYQMMNNRWERDQTSQSAITPEYFTGIYGMWNIYTISLLYLYAPMGKKIIQQQSEKEKIYTIFSPS
ncbi:hypothetical protein PV328_006668 [Microctonus aethiopoides]|uniref:Protein wntless n=1 Tax=Microctonus aethiopoides TaxID=144406 RepID=A0AA39FQF8_9HYME|nr:hypothetical protein PV328_006668 [Microctonus aethiopoides]